MRKPVKRTVEIFLVCASMVFLALLLTRHESKTSRPRLRNAGSVAVRPENLESPGKPESADAPSSVGNFFQASHGLPQEEWFVPTDMLKVRLSVDADEMRKWKQVHDQLMRQHVMTDSLQRWFRGTFEDPETGYAEPVRFRLHGDLPNHWTDQRYSSFRIKFPKDRPWRHMRAVRFMVWRDKAGPIDVVVNEYARKHGLFFYRMGMATLQVNDGSSGCYNYVETISEETMALNRRTPSSVFSMDDHWLRGRYMYLGKTPHDMPGIHFRDRYNKEFKAVQWNNFLALRQIVHDSKEPVSAVQQREMVVRFKDIVASDPYLKFCALSVLFNSDHLHGSQNQKWYCDPASGQLHPIHWDTHIFPTRQDDPLYRGMRAALWMLQQDDQAYLDYMNHLFILVEDESPAIALFDTMAERVLKNDRDSKQSAKNDLEVFRKMLLLRFAFLRRTLLSPQVVMRLERLSDVKYRLMIATEGYCPVKIDSITLPISDAAGSVTVTDEQENTVSRLLTTAGGTSAYWAADLVVIPGNNSIRHASQTRSFLIEYSQPRTAENGMSIDVTATNMLNHLDLRSSQILTQFISKDAGGVHQSIFDWTMRDRLDVDEEKKLIRFPAGRYRVNRSLICPAGYSVTIDADAKFEMAARCWLVVQGPLKVDGRSEAPVTFRAANSEKHWGGICVRGNGQTQVQLDHLQMSSTIAGPVYRMDQMGSLALVDVVATLRHCRLEEIHSEDALNLVRAKASIHNCIFRDISGDAIDLDWATSEVVDCEFQNISGDAIDCNATTARVLSCSIRGAKDKGISCGEGSTITVGRCNIRECDIGVAVKDGSRVRIGMSQINNCRIGVSLYQKKPTFSGGHGLVEYSSFDTNQHDLAVDALSHVERVHSVGNRSYIDLGGKIDDSAIEGKELPEIPPEVRKRYQ